MSKQKFCYTILLLFSIALTGCSSTKVVKTPQIQDDREIDGNLTGWNLENSVIERTDVANYYSSHNNEFLYLYIDIKSPGMNNAIRQSGFTIYLNSNEEKRDQTGIAFPSGSFNLLREIPGSYNSLINDPEWMQKPDNRSTLNSLEENIFNRVMIVERTGSSENYGFVDKEQLEIDGIQLAAGENRRLTGIEMRIPLQNNSIYRLNGDRIWVGFQIDPPEFRLQNNNNMDQQRNARNRGMTQTNESRRVNLRQRMGQYERWYLLNLER